jgi:hypothetical protein
VFVQTVLLGRGSQDRSIRLVNKMTECTGSDIFREKSVHLANGIANAIYVRPGSRELQQGMLNPEYVIADCGPDTENLTRFEPKACFRVLSSAVNQQTGLDRGFVVNDLVKDLGRLSDKYGMLYVFPGAILEHRLCLIRISFCRAI